MARLINFSAFLSVVLRGLTLILQSLLIGGTAFQALVFSRARAHAGSDEVNRPMYFTMRIAAAGLALAQSALVGLNCLVLARTTGMDFREAITAEFALAGLATVLACIVLFVALGKGPRPLASQAGLVLVIMLSTLATSHAWSRVEHRAAAAGLTFMHQLAAGLWIGGLPFLLIALHRITGAERLTRLAQGFSRMAMAGVTALVIGGAGLCFFYMKSPSDLYQTSYGAMIGSKILLMAAALGLGGANSLLIRRLGQDPAHQFRRLRRFVEVEIGIGLTVLIAAASLSSQVPAVDVVEGRVTQRDVVERFSPRMPRLSTPAYSELSPVAPVRRPNTPGDIGWSEYNHHWAGVIVLGMGILALVSLHEKLTWARSWPLLMIGLAAFLLLRADPENWPLGPNGFWESFLNDEVLQHRLFTLLILAFAIFEWRVQNGYNRSAWMPYVFPGICALGGAALLGHSHALPSKESTLIELSHIPIAVCGIYAGCARWLQLRMDQENSKAFSWIWKLCFVIIGVALLWYREG
ncbi:MAG TPA: CopD family protein [Terriglobales bacterium]|nr:CopD family protein [Terriglobales bacterium]